MITMSKMAETTICWLLLATCTAVFINPMLAQAQRPSPFIGLIPNLPGQLPPPFGGIIPKFPGLLPPSPATPVDIRQCWSALTNIQGCLFEIYRSAISTQFGQIGPDCCRAVNTVAESCWPKMFPLVPLFPPLLKNNCAGFKAAPPEPK
ncbi:hypothetical protein PTKIN_Ptkin14bG0045900 [Pterospermum kingtungense]